MNRRLVVERDDSEHPPIQLGHRGPKSPAIALLPLYSDGFLYYPDAPLTTQIRALPEDLLFEVRREPVLGHAGR
ncbi:MAG: hypothetical protein Q8K82_18290 [Gemmatimonadaceae bacterium]|nr:hypothetical protein [Gemmatimonadaceae bacterium]